jgi:hypothetical protein
MKKSLLYVVAVVSLTVLFSVGAVAQKSVEGEWDAVFNTPGGPRPFKLVLKVDGERLTGTAKRPSGDVPVAGTIKGIDISFSYSISYNGNTVTLNYTGKVSGDSMSGTVMFNENASDEWSAKRTSAKQ